MNKLSKRQRLHNLRIQVRKNKLGKVKSHERCILKRKRIKEIVLRSSINQLYPQVPYRNALVKRIYQKRAYKGPPLEVEITDEFGIEEKTGFSKFIDYAEELVNFNSKRLHIDFKNCTRVWPSAITLLCSLGQWVEMTARRNRLPSIGSSESDSDKVNSYLNHCGFYDYISREKNISSHYYKEDQIVKIRRERNQENIEIRENEIVALLDKYSRLDSDGLEEFNDVVLTEIFNNVEEHGMPNRDRGWWLLCQFHPKHKLISLCVADNGIGIQNSLLSGPQAGEIRKKVKNRPKKDGELIYIACEENTSGALLAPMKHGTIIKKYSKGSRRGNGLSRILQTCSKLSIPISILSHKGYLLINKEGMVDTYDSRQNRVFAGTMYHLTIPGRKDVEH